MSNGNFMYIVEEKSTFRIKKSLKIYSVWICVYALMRDKEEANKKAS